MKVAICDDNEMELQVLFGMISKYQERYPALDMELDRFPSVELLCKQPAGQYQLLLLDILMPRMDGIEFVRLLRSNGCQTAVIFITSSPDFALDAYSVNAVQYLLKPINEKLLFETLDTILPTIEQQQTDSIVVSTQEGIKHLYYHNIVFVECARHLVYFHLSDNSTVCSKTLRQSFVHYISPLLADKRFLHPHHSFCVNKEYVSKLSQRNFELYGGHIVPIAKDRYVEIKNDYLRYLDQ